MTKYNCYKEVECATCGKKFNKLKKYIERMKGDKHFCCKECYDQYQRKTKSSKETFICENCGKEVVKNSDTYNSKSKHHFCSTICAGEFNTKQNTITLTCPQCNKEFVKPKSAVKNTKHNFCSSECRKLYHTKHCTKCGKPFPKNRKYDLCSECLAEERHNEKYIKFNCAYCGKESERLKIHAKGETLFCSKKMYGVIYENRSCKISRCI